MKKFFLLVLSVSAVLVIGWCHSGDFKNTSLTWSADFGQRLEKYIASNFSSWYYCDVLPDHKYFFDVVSLPYKDTGEYLVSFKVLWYTATQLGKITNCGWGGGGLIVRDNGTGISLIYKFADFPELETRKDDHSRLPKNVPDTTYEQARRYFLK